MNDLMLLFEKWSRHELVEQMSKVSKGKKKKKANSYVCPAPA